MENNNKHTPEVTEMTGKKAYLPEHYIETPEPLFKGNGEHNVLELEQICEDYKEYAHQADIAFYSCSRKVDFLTRELSELREAMTEEQVTHTGEPLREKAFEIYLRHLCENRLNPVFTESQVAVNAMIEFYELMKK